MSADLTKILSGATGEAISSGIDAGFSALAARRAYRRQKKLFKFQNLKGPSFKVEGLRRAGLNPILAAGTGVTGGNVPSVAQAARPQPIDFSKGMERALVQQQIATAREQQRLTTAQTDHVDALGANEKLKNDALKAMPQEIRTQLEAYQKGGFWGAMQALLGQIYNQANSAKDYNERPGSIPIEEWLPYDDNAKNIRNFRHKGISREK